VEEIAALLKTQPERVAETVAAREQERRELAKRGPAASGDGTDAESLAAKAGEIGGVSVLAEVVAAAGERELLAVMDQLKAKLGDAAVVLGADVDGRALLVASVAPALVERGVKAGDVIKAAATVAGGGGGGRDTMARAGGKSPEKLPEAMDAARAAIAGALS
jgi:alanyl-tRNA synthetase